ncbi:DUF3850 domain-containing protein [Aeromonas salmonicida]|uniref:DUF3850 domain-containing protein n=1 Tax=Aeromonas salmonicida TaxID=645 RepID=UPI0038B8424B
MNQITHERKIAPRYFMAVTAGDKTFEIRDNSDRDFQKGDLVVLKEFDSGLSQMAELCYTGQQVTKVITYVTDFAQQPGFVVFAMADPDLSTEEHAV